MAITKINSLGVNLTSPTTFSAGTAALPSLTFTGDTNTGVFAPAADTIAFTEGGTEAMRIDSSANLQFNSGFGSVGTAFGVRAWVSFNGTGTVAIRGSGNVSSITDQAVGKYLVNFTNSMPDTNYVALQGNNYYGLGLLDNYLVGSLRIVVLNEVFADQDTNFVSVAILR